MINWRSDIIRLGLVIVLMAFVSCSVTVRQYSIAEKHLEDCVDGVRAPADEFCVDDSDAWSEAMEKMDERLAGLKEKHPKRYQKLQKRVSIIDVRWYDFMEKFDNRFED